MATGEPPGVPPISALTRKAWWRLSTKSAGEICKTSINRRACNGVNFCPEAWWLQRRGNAPDADAMERLSAGSLSHRRIELSTRAVSMHAAQTPDRGRQRQLRAARSNLRQLRRASLSGPTAPRLRTTAPSRPTSACAIQGLLCQPVCRFLPASIPKIGGPRQQHRRNIGRASTTCRVVCHVVRTRLQRPHWRASRRRAGGDPHRGTPVAVMCYN